MTNLDVLQEDVKRMAAVMDPDYPNLPKVSKRKRKDETEGECMARVAQEEADREKVKGQWRQLEAMARTFLEEAFLICEEKTNFVVVGQLHYSTELGFLRDNGDRVGFGPFAKLREAEDAFTQLTYNKGTDEEFRAWLVPYYQGTPAQWFLHRKRVRAAAEDVPLTNAEKLIVKYNPENAYRWGLTPEGGRLQQGASPAEASAESAA